MIKINPQTLIPIFSIGFLNLEDFLFTKVYPYSRFFRHQNKQFQNDISQITNDKIETKNLIDQSIILQQYDEIPYSLQIKSALLYNMIFDPIQKNLQILTPIFLTASIFAPVITQRILGLFFITRAGVMICDQYQIKNYKRACIKQDEYKKFILNTTLIAFTGICFFTPLYKFMKFNAVKYQQNVSREIIQIEKEKTRLLIR